MMLPTCCVLKDDATNIDVAYAREGECMGMGARTLIIPCD